MRIRCLSLYLQVSVLGMLLTASTVMADADAQFSRANQQYAAGKFSDAVADYEAVVHQGDWSAPLFYNLGNAYFRTRDFGKAILNYERALALEPNHPEAQANLRVAREEARALELAPTWPDRFTRFASLNAYTMTAAILFWGGVFLLVIVVFSNRQRRAAILLAICLLMGAAFLAYLVRAIEIGPKGRSLAVVTGNEAQARLATADTAASVLALPSGSEVRIEQERGDWVYASLPNNLRGWIPAKSIERVRL